ncbi:FAD-dependent oxidoreductase [Tunturiibacter gelidoferens]|uniref:2-polyprenyl-6-methoxyphenol hydroxylase-like FAD-dependent oxidoreductase n=1 Tax=Tunturiibacter gelidiferens TaxID=3069689 RepID=A0A9X0U5T7_9BACT|nr:FAD-dependent oxidoreductase [Edaphobacter lichenicola]MBB5330864.1 2-polyprenyl-6-methoxyphenol hydroxylase-like FAD-dependent oxidoreductase [Edaphobacter lichenicola]
MATNPNPLATTCCIIGGGPAGIMLGFLLARAGVKVTVLEKHKDFFRDFRGDTIHPSTLDLLHELGLLEKFLTIPHSQVAALSAIVGGERFAIADFSHVPTYCKFIALMPQWDFLDFLSSEATRYPSFNLRMGWEATGLINENGVTTGVRANTPDGPVEIPATVTIGCDGRHAISRDAGHLPLNDEGVPIDVLWLKIARQPSDPENALGYINYGRLIILINRNDYFQVGYIIAKGTFPQIQQAGIPAFQQSIERIVPFLAGRTTEIDSWDKVKLLTIQVNRLQEWSSPGLLCIGDAAHAMSPVGGIGINIAIQDAVATANILTEALLSNSLTQHHLRQVQDYRETAVRNTQRVQVFAHRILDRVLRDNGPIKSPLALRILTHIPGFQNLPARFVGVGLQPQHIKNF